MLWIKHILIFLFFVYYYYYKYTNKSSMIKYMRECFALCNRKFLFFFTKEWFFILDKFHQSRSRFLKIKLIYVILSLHLLSHVHISFFFHFISFLHYFSIFQTCFEQNRHHRWINKLEKFFAYEWRVDLKI